VVWSPSPKSGSEGPSLHLSHSIASTILPTCSSSSLRSWHTRRSETSRVQSAIETLAADPTTTWVPAGGAETDKSSQIAECDFSFADRALRLIVRRQPTKPGDQLSCDDLDGWRFRAIITNIDVHLRSGADVKAHHRLRGGGPEEAIRQLKGDFGLCHAPVANCFGNWLWWHAAALAYNVARWLKVLALPEAFATCRGKRLRLGFLNVAAKVVRHGRRLILRLPRAYTHARAFIDALGRAAKVTCLRLSRV